LHASAGALIAAPRARHCLCGPTTQKQTTPLIPVQACTWEFDADRRRVVTLLGPGLAARGAGCTGVMGGGAAKKPKTLRDAIRIQSKQPR
jgi:hypothetical protein